MPYRWNPFTGRLDDVGTGGGGGGTVTAVAGGVGITNTPDPIVGAGSVNLDINDLTAESTLAAGDLFAFVDVSVGTTFADQRKVTLGDIAAFIGSSSGADCTTAPTLLCLAGRTGTANDPLISTNAFGSVTGTGAAGLAGIFLGLALNARTETEVTGNYISPFRNTATWTGPNALFSFGNDIEVNDLPGFGLPAIVGGFQVGATGNEFGPGASTWTIGDDSLGGMTGFLFRFAPLIKNPTGVTKSLGQLFEIYQAQPRFVADDATCTIGEWFCVQSDPHVGTTGSGVLNFSAAITAIQNRLVATPGSTGAVNLAGFVGLRHLSPNGGQIASNGGADIVVECGGDASPLPAGTYASVNSSGPLRPLLHVGPGVFGANAFTGAFILEAIGDVHISGKLTLDGALDPTDILYSGQLTSTVASGTAPMVIASTDVVANLNADLLDGLHAVDFAQILSPVRLAAQVADIADTTITSTAGLYRVEVYALDTTADVLAGAITIHIKFADGSGSRDVTVGPVALTALTGVVSATIFARLVSGNLTYGVTHTGLFGSAAYALDVTTERLAA